MERNANYALVGFATLVLFLGLIVFVVWLSRISFSQQYTDYNIEFVGPVRGLSTGGEVHFNGIKVGDVSSIVLDKTNPKNVIARVRVTADVPIRADSFATLEPQGITGVNYVQISAGTANRPLLKDATPSGQLPVIQSRPSALSDLLSGSGTVLAASVDALNRVNRVLSDQNIKTITATLGDVEDVTAELRRRKALLADADAALKSVDATAQSITKLSDDSRTLVDGDGRRTLKDAADAAAEIKAAAGDARALVAKLQGPTTDFATNGLPQLTGAIVSLQQSADSLKRLTDEAQQNPRALVAKSPPKEIEVKP
jgi:phospholipid/cholesterol/gamma-HCH transport system substrate-binding protein